MKYDIFNLPIGQLTVATDGTHITSLHIEGDRYFTAVPSDWQQASSHQLLQRVKTQLQEYFEGTRQQFDLPLKTNGTSFQEAVWRVLQDISTGTTASYGHIARKIGQPEAARAVGTAIGHNPICIIVPCHRVLAADGSLGGYVAGPERKQQLLDLEKI